MKAAQISASRNTSHLCNASSNKRNSNCNAEVVDTHCFLAYSQTEIDTWAIIFNEHWGLGLDIANLICLRDGTHTKKKNNLSEGVSSCLTGNLREFLSAQTSFPS